MRATRNSYSQPTSPTRPHTATVLVAIGLLLCLGTNTSPAIALSLGAAIGLTFGDPLSGRSRPLSSLILKFAVVGLGFGLSLPAVVATGRAGFFATAAGVAIALIVGALLGRWMHVEPTTSTMISGGTAICGGSAIAAIAPAVGATSSAIGMAMTTVFLLNGAALYIFPAIGHVVGLSQEQFGVWAAMAIHDTSSVVGAAAQFGDRSLELATVLKLVRALWILPLVFGTALWKRRVSHENNERRTPTPWFIGLFVAASGLRTILPSAAGIFEVLDHFARRLLVVALFLVGLSLTRSTIRGVGLQPLAQGVALWLIIAMGSLGFVLAVPDLT